MSALAAGQLTKSHMRLNRSSSNLQSLTDSGKIIPTGKLWLYIYIQPLFIIVST